MLPYINIQSKCSIGYSDWGSKDPDYRPREHANTDDSDSSGTSTNQDLANTQKNMDQMNQDKTTYDNAVNDAKAKCQALCTADDNLAAAHQKDDPIINDPNASASAKSAAQADLQNAIKAQQQAKSANDTAQKNLNSATSSFQNDLNNLNNESSVGKQSSLPSIPCGCN
jgi:chromosome segregation ATPase